jgi:RHS repeat-associated protein
VENRWYPAANRCVRVEWDFEDRLVKVTKNDGTVVENTYDVDGVLVRTAVNGVATDYLVDASGGLSHVVAEVDGSGAVTVLYVRAGDMLLEEIRGGVVKMYEADGLASTRSLLDTTGVQTDTWSYEAFGTTLSSTGTRANPYRFAGERFVADVGMYQNRARWLDTRVGRFLSVDPERGKFREPMTLQHYLYAAAQPTTLVDPSGRDFTLVGVVINVAMQSILGSAPTAAGGAAKTAHVVAERERIAATAERYIGSTDFQLEDSCVLGSVRANANQYKCNFFVYQVLSDAGVTPVWTSAANWASQTRNIQGFTLVGTPKRGDVVGSPARRGEGHGHSGIVASPGVAISAYERIMPDGSIDDRIFADDIMWRRNPEAGPVFHRWKGDVVP